MMSERTDPSLRLAPCSSLSMRMDVAAPLADELLAGAGEVAQRLHVGGRHEARADQAMREEIGEPGRVVHVRLAARHSLDVGRVGQGERALRLPHSTAQTGFQYTPVASMTTCVTPWLFSHADK